MYKYSLDKSSKKFSCPKCGKRTFVRYFNNETTYYLETQLGRCDKESSCKYHNSPKNNNTLYFPSETLFKREKSTIPKIEVTKHGQDFKNNYFIQFLRNHFPDEQIKLTITKYLIGTSNHWRGATVFWQIDDKEAIVTGKIMLLDINTGKRVKKPYNHINWMHKTLKIPNYELQQCLFGLHLINEYPEKTIALVESEKTAITMSLFLPNYLWIATGSKANLKKKLLEPIKNFKIIVYPDKSEYNDWNKKATQLNQEGYQIRCSDYVEKKDVPEGTDLADIYFQSKTSEIVEIKYTKAEIEVNRLAKINPEIINLVRTFELLDGDDNRIVNIGCF
jgi:ssDNA-binding Zn-finger/Zn-ribbon topoisomerase 1